MAVKELTLAENPELRWMISSRKHPNRIEAYLAECGCSPAEIEQVFDEFLIRVFL